jgi:hypothetical protein
MATQAKPVWWEIILGFLLPSGLRLFEFPNTIEKAATDLLIVLMAAAGGWLIYDGFTWEKAGSD